MRRAGGRNGVVPPPGTRAETAESLPVGRLVDAVVHDLGVGAIAVARERWTMREKHAVSRGFSFIRQGQGA